MAKTLKIFVGAIVLAASSLATAARPQAEMHMLNDGYVVGTFQKYVGPHIFLCPDETVKKGGCGPVVEGVTAQQYLDGRFGPNLTRVVGLGPGTTSTKVVIYYQINPARMNGFAAH